jgi:hypothetical protein
MLYGLFHLDQELDEADIVIESLYAGQELRK